MEEDSEGEEEEEERDGRQAPVVVDAVWRRADFVPQVIPFSGNPGLKIWPVGNEPSDFLALFLKDEDFEHLVVETNRYAEQQIAATGVLQRTSRAQAWKPVSLGEMQVFIAVTFLMGLVRKPSVSDYWSRDTFTCTPLLSSTMSRNRFQNILKYFHCNDSSKAKKKGEPGFDPLYRIRPLHDKFKIRCRETYTPEREVTIDEGGMGWRGHISYLVYNPMKPNKYHIKKYKICEARSGYTCDNEIYTGSNPDPNHNKPFNVVVRLLTNTDLFGRGYSLYTDRWYTSPDLFNYLYTRQVNSTGTVMGNRKGLPKTEIKNLRLARGQLADFVRGTLSCQVWKDKRDVILLSTEHGHRMVEVQSRGGRIKMKPTSVLEYNKFKAGVDTNDRLEEEYFMELTSRKLHKKLLFHEINCMLTNAFIIYKKVNREATHKGFIEAVASEFIMRGRAERGNQERGYQGNAPDAFRLQGRHFPSFHVLGNDGKPQQKQCHVCGKKQVRKRTSVQCKDCSVALCHVPCFALFHTKKDYWIQEQFESDTSASDDDDM